MPLRRILGKQVTRHVLPGQVVGSESLSRGKISTEASTSSANTFADHCTCVTPVTAVSFAAADYRAILKFVALRR
jgi:hypothetical protein